MKRILQLTVISVALLAACSPVKKTLTARQATTTSVSAKVEMEKHTTTDSLARTQASDMTHAEQSTAIITDLAGSEEVTTITREYDTTQPTDSATGTPPILRETTQTRRRSTQSKQTQTSALTADRRRETTVDTRLQRHENTVSHSQNQTEGTASATLDNQQARGLSPLQNLLCIIGVLALAWLGFKLFKRI